MRDQYQLGWLQKLSFGTGHILNDLCASVWFSYLLVFLQFVLEIPSGLAGITLLVGQIVDAFATPIIGVLSDHGKCCHPRAQFLCGYGKRKIWHLIGSICVIVSFPLMFVGCLGMCNRTNELGYLIVLVLLVCVFQFGWAATQISHLAMIPEMSSVESVRDELNIIRFSFDVITDIMVYGIAFFIFTTGSTGLDQVDTRNGPDFTLLAVSVTLIGAFFTIIFHVGVREVNPVVEWNEAITETALRNQWLAWFGDWHFYRVGVLYTAARLAHNLSTVFVPLYLQENRQSSEMLALIPLVMNFAGLIGSGILKYIIQFFGKKAAYVLSSTVGLTSCLWLLIDRASISSAEADHILDTEPAEFYAQAAMMGGGAAMTVILSLTSAADLIHDNTETSAFVYGCMSFCDKMASGLLVAFIQGLHSWICEDGTCHRFYGQVLIYGVGIPLILVVFSCWGAPTSYDNQRRRNSNKSTAYGACQDLQSALTDPVY